ncbi:MAG: SDR family NAD(P)-dependent oxidoreductase [Caulobacteraceae bacterium]|nr:SDR family NAD(P)-dependent oxidoreductase [Caulobacteraceae bacterium]
MSGAAIVTGGGGAIALVLAQSLAQRGYRLVLVDIDEARLAQSASQIKGAVSTLRADLTQPADLERVADLIAQTPDLTLLVNNAGIIRPGPVVDLPYAALELHIAINLLAPMRLTQAAAQAMSARGAGCILSIVSAAGLAALPGSAAYSASKFGLRGFLTAVSQEVSGHGVKIRSVFPGAVDTPMLRYEATHGGSALNFLNKDVLTPRDVARACLKAMDGRSLEVHLPFWDGVLARILCIAPDLMATALPHFQKSGEAGLQRFLKSRGLVPVDGADARRDVNG